MFHGELIEAPSGLTSSVRRVMSKPVMDKRCYGITHGISSARECNPVLVASAPIVIPESKEFKPTPEEKLINDRFVPMISMEEIKGREEKKVFKKPILLKPVEDIVPLFPEAPKKPLWKKKQDNKKGGNDKRKVKGDRNNWKKREIKLNEVKVVPVPQPPPQHLVVAPNLEQVPVAQAPVEPDPIVAAPHQIAEAPAPPRDLVRDYHSLEDLVIPPKYCCQQGQGLDTTIKFQPGVIVIPPTKDERTVLAVTTPIRYEGIYFQCATLSQIKTNWFVVAAALIVILLASIFATPWMLFLLPVVPLFVVLSVTPFAYRVETPMKINVLYAIELINRFISRKPEEVDRWMKLGFMNELTTVNSNLQEIIKLAPDTVAYVKAYLRQYEHRDAIIS